MPRLPPGLSTASLQRPCHPPWFPPVGAGGTDAEALTAGWRGLYLRNTLTDEKEKFIPHDGRRVRWYTCGPTVYDVSHMGHARAYLTFDIFRRILTGYFGYEFLYCMNITDVDDKIIKRARVNELVSKYEANIPKDTFKADVAAALALAREKLADLEKRHAVDVAAGTFATDEDRLAQEAIFTMKADQLNTIEAKVAASANDAAALDAARGILGDLLDLRHGADVTDHSVFREHARHYEREFYDDMNSLGVLPADVMVRVTEHIPEIVDYIQKIVDAGLAYEANGSVYFDVAAYKGAGHPYPCLRRGGGEATAAEMAEGEGDLVGEATEKKGKVDFVLWKKSRAGEPRWPSPWGDGRPGWHIECSVMASGVLGETMDIHGGGIDLHFPHHENEIAQAQACTGVGQWCNYFVHAGHLHIKGLKMSKSLKNFVTIRQALEVYTPQQLRLLFVLQRWNAPMDFSDQKMDDAKQKEARIKSFLRTAQHIAKKTDWAAAAQKWSETEFALDKKVDVAREAVHAAFCDDLNTPAVMNALLDLITAANTYMSTAAEPRAPLVAKISLYIERTLAIFGLDFTAGAETGGKADAAVDALVAFRKQVRAAAVGGDVAALKSVMAACDAVRDDALPDLGVRLDDAGLDSRWAWDKPEEIRAAIAAKRAAAAAAAAEKAANVRARRAQELEKAAGLVAPATEIFRSEADAATLYAAYDERGVPTEVFEEGARVAVPKSQKKLEKRYTTYVAARAKVEEKAAAAGISVAEYIEKLRASVDEA